MPNTNKNGFEKLISKTKIYLTIIAILLIILCIYEINLVLPSILIYSIILVYAFWTNNKKKAEISKHLEQLTLNVDSVAKNTLINSPFPLVVVETDGNVIWKSTKFVNEFANIDINNRLEEIIKELKLEIETQQENNKRDIEKNITIEGKTYEVLGKYVKSRLKDKKKNTEYMMILYFVDKTEYLQTIKKCEDTKTCLGILVIDNYEEIIQRMSNEEKTQVMAQIEKAIYQWAGLSKGLVIKSERNLYTYVFEQKYLEEIENSKFSILDIVKEIKTQDNLQITLSIAVTNEGESNYEKYKSASSAMDIVLGRGGDQAVVRKDGKYTFFGGRTQELEKRTKVKARIVAHALEELMQQASNIVIMGHTNPDIDCIGSSVGIYKLAKSLGKEANIVNTISSLTISNFINAIQKEEEYKNVFIDKPQALTKISMDTLLVIVDTHKRNYVEVPELIEKTNKIVIIDHHRRSTDYIDQSILDFHEVYASSAAELVTELLQYAQKEVSLSTIEAESLYAGIMVDTKNFTFKTGVRTFEAAAYLRKCGVDIIRVKKWFQSDIDTYNKIADIVKRAEMVNESIAISIYDKTDKDASLICAKAADELLTISNITASFVIGNVGDKVCISGRSIGEINVQVILEKLGGGGHITLAGAQVEGMTQEEVKQELIDKIKEYFNEIVG